MKRLIALCAFALSSAVFAGAPLLPSDISTWISETSTCAPRLGIVLNETIYVKKDERGNRHIITTTDRGGQRVAQFELTFPKSSDVVYMKFILRKKKGWVTYAVRSTDVEDPHLFAQDMEAALGISSEEYRKCGR